MSENFVNQLFLEQLVQMGFSREISKNALLITGNRSLDEALNALIVQQSYDYGGFNNNKNGDQKKEPEQEQDEELNLTSEDEDSSEKKSSDSSEGEGIGFSNDSTNSDFYSDNEKGNKKEKEKNFSDSYTSESDGFINESNENSNDFSDYESDNNDLFDEVNIEEKKNAYDTETIITKQAEEIEKMAKILKLSSTSTGALLRFFKWNKDKLMDRMMTKPNKTLKEAKITRFVSTKKYKPKDMLCQVCFTALEPKKYYCMRCQHGFCLTCWRSYLKTKIESGEVGKIQCQGYKCTELVHETIIKKIVTKELFKKYMYFIATSFVDLNPNLTWCTQKGCNKVLPKEMILRGSNVVCSCNNRFCFYCKKEAHSPATCEESEKWEKKSKDDSETMNWIISNTQTCPKCRVSIEKNQGCNHMTCRNCKYEFCWICLADWKKHGYSYNCNKYRPKDKEKQDNSKAALERYLHYFQRFDNHEKSLGFEKELRRKTRYKMHQMQDEKNMNYIDVSFMEEAVAVLCSCRSCLKWTYVFAFYLKDRSKGKELFEFVQQELEQSTEHLSEILERKFNKIDKMEAINATRIVKIRLDHLFDTVESGLPD
ncbi:e3 ubiquitin-protein ligase ari5-related [Anaeramoeba flamelloides]|uniref:RBR-type E3 ubiquitin transferase n=1 Tax=Anaeramoeba flamelloides TaxID=1746091 RepID=A0AAV7Y4U1_9EUKA|nr:e3 ubiquitin-protein ligase ari5-related [Anaeramoeba flamelloides]KAJ6232874.1 e3 ubiquitin-protein ligase ari5-related [Anaeramoeba flamelloides]